MNLTRRINKILSYYESDNPGTKVNLAKLLMHGRLGGTGRMIILPVDQGFEHGPRTFVSNSAAFHPHYHFQMAIKAGLSAYAAPLGWLEAGADTFAGRVPTILKINSGNSLFSKDNPPNQAITGSIDDALRLGCLAIGFTIYPGSDASLDMFEDVRELAAEAKACGLAVIIWSYPRGALSKDGETAIDTIAYGAHIAALLGAHIIKVKPPSSHLENKEAQQQYERHGVKISTLEERVRHVVQSCFQGRRLVIFSGGETKGMDGIFEDAKAIVAGGGNGLIIGRNTFQRSQEEALKMLAGLTEIFKKSTK